MLRIFIIYSIQVQCKGYLHTSVLLNKSKNNIQGLLNVFDKKRHKLFLYRMSCTCNQIPNEKSYTCVSNTLI